MESRSKQDNRRKKQRVPNVGINPLETELAELKKEFAALDELKTSEPAKSDGAKKSKQTQGDGESKNTIGQHDELDDVSTLRTMDIEGITTKAIEGFEDTIDKKTLLIAFGVFFAGYLIGRSR